MFALVHRWWLALALAVTACASAAPPTDPPPSSSAAAPDEPLESLETRLNQRIAMLQRVLGETEAEQHARTALALAEACLDHIYLLNEQRYEHAMRSPDPSDVAAQTQWARTDEALATRREHRLGQAEDGYDRAMQSSELPSDLMAKARYGRAMIRKERGDEARALEDLAALLREHPNHALASQAALMLADAEFAEQHLSDAKHLYLLVSDRGDLHSQLYARYRLGWIAFNREEIQVALDRWVDVVLRARTLDHSVALADAAAKDCVFAYARVGKPEAAVAFFQRLHPGQSLALLQRLVRIYREEGRTEDAESVGIAVPPDQR